MRRIITVPQDMSWEEFYKTYKNFFPISDDQKRDAKLKEEFKRLTGKIADGKIKGPAGKSKSAQRTRNEGFAFGSHSGQQQTSGQP